MQNVATGQPLPPATKQILHKVRTVQPHSLRGLGKLQVNVQNLLDFYLLENAFEF